MIGPYCNWPVCLPEDQQQLLAEECRIEMETGEPCSIYFDKYPCDQREMCGCVDVKDLTPDLL